MAYGRLTAKAHAECGRKKWAWLIKGESIGKPLPDPVVIPPLSGFLEAKNVVHQNTIIRISKADFDNIKTYAQSHRFDPKRIPCLGRDPQSEQEVLAVIATGYKLLGIEEILRIQTRFPDMLVKIKGRTDPVHLELELYSSSFKLHGHGNQVRAKRLSLKGDADHKPVGVLCWIDDDRKGQVARKVHRIYELRSLLRERGTIRWGRG
jgi:hypothetical protein